MTCRWSCTSIVGTGSILALKLNSVYAPSGWRRAPPFTWWPSISEKLATSGLVSMCPPLNANAWLQSSLASASGSSGVPSAKVAAISTLCAASARSIVSVDVRANAPRDRLLEVRHGLEAEAPGRVAVALHHFREPRHPRVDQEELRVLPGEVFVMQVQPVVILERAVHHFGIPNLREWDTGVL